MRNAFIVLSALLAAAVFFLSVTLRNKENVVVLVPSVVKDGTIAHGGQVDGKYLEGLARDAVYSILNVTPETTDYSRNNLGRLAAPYARAEILTLWDDIMEEVRSRQIATVFYPASLEVAVENLEVVIEGKLSTFLGLSLVATERQRYRISFAPVNGSVRISKIVEEELPS